MARDRDDDYDDRPARRNRDDYDGDDFDDRPARGARGPLDGTFRDTNIVVLILFGVCCGVIAFVLSLVGYLTGKDPKAKSNALLVMIISGVLTALGIVSQIIMGGMLAGGAGGAR